MSKKTNELKSSIRKIIYFDKETIKNILQELNNGDKSTIIKSNEHTSSKVNSTISAEVKFKLQIPFWARLKFLFSSNLSAQYKSQFDSTTTITTTEISDFEKIKSCFIEFKNVSVSDIENSSTFFRVAGNYLRILKGGVKDVDSKEFKNVMDGYEGYDHYRINEKTYVRFNNSAFMSNYKRNDLLNSKLLLFCIPIGEFPYSNFNFIEQLNKMQKLSTETSKSLNDLYPSLNTDKIEGKKQKTEKSITLYDVVYACIYQGDNDEKV